MKAQKMDIFKIGKITDKNPGLIQLVKDEKTIDISPKGWEHFS